MMKRCCVMYMACIVVFVGAAQADEQPEKLVHVRIEEWERIHNGDVLRAIKARAAAARIRLPDNPEHYTMQESELWYILVRYSHAGFSGRGGVVFYLPSLDSSMGLLSRIDVRSLEPVVIPQGLAQGEISPAFHDLIRALRTHPDDDYWDVVVNPPERMRLYIYREVRRPGLQALPVTIYMIASLDEDGETPVEVVHFYHRAADNRYDE